MSQQVAATVDMTSEEEQEVASSSLPPFSLQPILNNVFQQKDLLDFGQDAESSPAANNAPQQPLNLFSLVSGTVAGTTAAASRRAQAIASAKSAEDAEVVSGKVVLRCVEGYGNNLYLGSSDGVIYWYTIDGSGPSSEGAFKLRNKHTLFPRRPVSKIILLPVVGKALVLSDGTLNFFTLPTLDPVPSALINPIRGVITAVIDDAEMDADTDKPAEMGLCVIKRKSIMLFRLGARLMTDRDVIQEIPLPNGATTASRTRTTLCIAESVDKLYNMIDLENAQLWPLLPYSQIDPSVADFDVTPSIAVVPGEREFLVTSYTGTGTIGIFLTAAGDPTRGTLEWESHPIAITLEAEFIIALCRDNTVVIHSINQTDKALQIINLPQGFEALGVVSSPYGISIPNTERDHRMRMVSIPLLAQSTPVKVDNEASGSGLTPPSSPKLPAATPFSTTIAETLIIGLNAVYALAPVPTIIQLEDLLARRKLDDAIAFVDEERRRGKRGEIDVDKNTHTATMRLLHLRLACALFSDTRFIKAGDYFAKGKLDVRLLVRLFPRIRGKVIGSAEEVEVFAGLEAPLREMEFVEEIVAGSLRRNYDPHIEPDADNAPETAELRSVLLSSASTMLTDFLRKTRVARRKGGGARGVDSRKIDIVLDTALAKLLAEGDAASDLLGLLAAPNDVVLSELEPFLAERKYILSKVMLQQGRLDRVLGLLREIADGDTDKLCVNPIGEITALLKTCTDEALVRETGLWLVKHDMEKAMDIFTTASVKFDDAALFKDMQAVSPEAAERFLEHVVVRKRSPNRELHETLLDHLMKAVAAFVKDDGIRYHFEELDSEYRLLSPQSFAQFFAEVAPSTPVKTARLKLLLFLQGSPFYALSAAAERLASIDFVLFERAIVQGRLGHHSQALALLAQDLSDSISAQTYCTLGEVLPPKVTRAIAHRMPELSAWATLGDVGRKRKSTVDPQTQDKLVMELLRVYMRDGAAKAPQAAALLDAQARHLDVGAVLEMVPDEWDLGIVSPFLTRSLRRQSHERASWQILKSITAGQNMQTAEKYLETIPRKPPAVERPSPGESFSSMRPSEGSIAEKEYTSIDEKRDEFPLNKERAEVDESGRGVV